MSRCPQPTIAPHIVEADDTATRRAVAITVAKAYATAPQTWTFLLLAGQLMLLITRLASGPWPSKTFMFLEAISYLLFCFAAYVGAVTVVSYRGAAAADKTVYFTRTSKASAGVTLSPDKRRGAEPGDMLASSAAAWPKRRGAGRVLAAAVLEKIHAEGRRITFTATPLLAPLYRRNGCVEEGRTALVLIRLATRPKPSKPHGSVQKAGSGLDISWTERIARVGGIGPSDR